MKIKESKISTFDSLRERYDRFIFHDFNYVIDEDWVSVTYRFSIDEVHFFNPRFRFSSNHAVRIEEKIESFESLLFYIGLIESISYWKCACPKELDIRCGSLDVWQQNWLQKLFYLGLGEFRYLNNITTSEDEFISFRSLGPFRSMGNLNLKDDYLIPLGGGKDSAVSLSIIDEISKAKIFLLSPREASFEVCYAKEIIDEDIFVIDRKIDPNLIALNQQGYLNGHTPFSALLSFYSCLAALLLDCKHIVLSNESSANEPTILGTDINHQYSKSYEYERDFRSFNSKYLSDNFNYFSLLRPINELQIARLFANEEWAFSVFKSCNVGSKKNIWCQDCSKCLFTFIMLSPFLPLEQLIKIFGDNLYDKESLRVYFDQLTGVADEKPFECVGTIDEVNAAISRFLKLDPKARKYTLLEHYTLTAPNSFENLLAEFEEAHYLPDHLSSILSRKGSV